jgi:hypothetical protein
MFIGRKHRNTHLQACVPKRCPAQTPSFAVFGCKSTDLLGGLIHEYELAA